MTHEQIERAAHKIVGLWIGQCNIDEWAEEDEYRVYADEITEAVERIAKGHLDQSHTVEDDIRQQSMVAEAARRLAEIRDRNS